MLKIVIFNKKDMKHTKDKAAIELDAAEKEKILFAENNERKKQQLISELKSGLGNEIKLNPGRVKIIKKTKIEKIKIWFKNIFTKF
jgi:hypothetical protein